MATKSSTFAVCHSKFRDHTEGRTYWPGNTIEGAAADEAIKQNRARKTDRPKAQKAAPENKAAAPAENK